MELATNQQAELNRLETVIQKNLQSFVQVGMALMKIRDSKLYQITNRTFEEYCNDRWQFSRRRAYQFIESVTVIENVNNCSHQPATESQTRPLTNLSPVQQKEAWTKAVETAPAGKVTAKHVESVVQEIVNPKQKNMNVIHPGDSDILFKLKSNWNQANKTDKGRFFKWLKQRKEI
jgi:hypothetical protein